MQHGVDHDGPVLGAGEERGTLGDEGQHSQAQIAIQGQRHLGSAECGLRQERKRGWWSERIVAVRKGASRENCNVRRANSELIHKFRTMDPPRAE